MFIKEINTPLDLFQNDVHKSIKVLDKILLLVIVFLIYDKLWQLFEVNKLFGDVLHHNVYCKLLKITCTNPMLDQVCLELNKQIQST